MPEGGDHLKKSILFITPPYRYGVADVIGRWVPLGFVYLAGAARAAGLAAEIYDARAKEHGYPEIEQRLRLSPASYVATTAITASSGDALKILELAKKIDPRVVTILGGVHPTFCHDELLAATTAVDYIVCGEGEETLRELLGLLENGGDPALIPGLAFRRGDAIVKTPARSAATDADELAPAWDLLHWPDYEYFVIPGSRMGAVALCRGSERGAAAHAATWPGRCRDPYLVVEEMAQLYAAHGVNVFLLVDDSPAEDRQRWELFLDLLVKRQLPLHLLMQTRSAHIVRDRDIIGKYRAAGIIHVYVALEQVGKGLRHAAKDDLLVAEGKLALDLLHEQGIVSEASFILGGPDETKAGVEATLKLARHFNPDNAQFIPVTPWPYDPAYGELSPFIGEKDYAKYNLIDPVIEPQKMSLRQVDIALMDCSRRYYMGKMVEIMTMKDKFKRDYLMRAMKLMMTSPFILKKLGIGTLGRSRPKK